MRILWEHSIQTVENKNEMKYLTTSWVQVQKKLLGESDLRRMVKKKRSIVYTNFRTEIQELGNQYKPEQVGQWPNNSHVWKLSWSQMASRKHRYRVVFPPIKDQRYQKPRSGEPLADTAGVKNTMCPCLCEHLDPKIQWEWCEGPRPALQYSDVAVRKLCLGFS